MSFSGYGIIKRDVYFWFDALLLQSPDTIRTPNSGISSNEKFRLDKSDIPKIRNTSGGTYACSSVQDNMSCISYPFYQLWTFFLYFHFTVEFLKSKQDEANITNCFSISLAYLPLGLRAPPYFRMVIILLHNCRPWLIKLFRSYFAAITQPSQKPTFLCL